MIKKLKILPDYNDPDDTGTYTGTEFRYFDISEVEQEEEYLTQKHREGWKLTKTGDFGIYHFESCEPEDVVYRIDFCPAASGDTENYLKMYEDYGWECASSVGNYRYFRKAADPASPAETEIFSDSESRLAMMHTIARQQFLFSIYSTLSSTLVFVLMYRQLTFDRMASVIGMSLCGAILLLFYAFLIRRIVGFVRFRKKYSIKKPG